MRSTCLGMVALLFCTSSFAQTLGRGHGIVGVGIVAATDDSAERTRFGPTATPGSLWLFDAAVFVAGRIGVGAEVLPLGSVTGASDIACCVFRDVERERALLVTGRWRALSRQQIAIDAVFGVGTILQHRETRMSLRSVPNSTMAAISDRYSPAWSVGADAPFLIVPHVAVSPLFRVYFLERGNENTPNVAFTRSAR